MIKLALLQTQKTPSKKRKESIPLHYRSMERVRTLEEEVSELDRELRRYNDSRIADPIRVRASA